MFAYLLRAPNVTQEFLPAAHKYSTLPTLAHHENTKTPDTVTMLGSKIRTLLAGPASIPVLRSRTSILHKNITTPFSTHPQSLHRIMYTDFTWADVHRLSNTHLTWDVDGWPIPVKSLLSFDRKGVPWPIAKNASDTIFHGPGANGVANDKNLLFADPTAQKCVFTYEFERADFSGYWDYIDGFNIAYCFLTRDSLVLYEELDRIAEAAGEAVSRISQISCHSMTDTLQAEWLLIVKIPGKDSTELREWRSPRSPSLSNCPATLTRKFLKRS
jgi:hypothetical protein